MSRPFFFSRKKKHEKAKKTPSCEVKCFSDGKTAQAKHGWCKNFQIIQSWVYGVYAIFAVCSPSDMPHQEKNADKNKVVQRQIKKKQQQHARKIADKAKTKNMKAQRRDKHSC